MYKYRFLKSFLYFLSFIAIICLVVFNLLRFLLPNNLVFIEGRTTEIYSPIPISIKNDDDTMNVLSVTTEPMATAFTLDIGSSMVANPIEIGMQDITFYLCNTLPIKTVSAKVVEEQQLIPVGQSVGITLDTDGLLVLDTGRVAVDGNNTESSLIEPAKGILQTGDLIYEANGTKLINKETLQKVVSKSNGEPIVFIINRDGVVMQKIIQPIFSEIEQDYKIGVWVRDSIQGIGTITYYNPETGEFGGLGHGIYDVDTGELMPMKQGMIISSNLTNIVKGQKGEPGELTGTVEKNNILGTVEINTPEGIYGTMEMDYFDYDITTIGLKHEVQIGEATILSNIEGDEIKEYKIEIQNLNGDKGKEMRIEVTDIELIEKTGGIIQGMSGSPILQNGKIIGAVTHVFVNEPTKGYGIFIENMLQTAETKESLAS